MGREEPRAINVHNERGEWERGRDCCGNCAVEGTRWFCYQGCRASVCRGCAPRYRAGVPFYCFSCHDERAGGP